MSNNLKERLEELQHRKDEKKIVDSRISDERTFFEEEVFLERKRLEEKLSPLKISSQKLGEEVDRLGKDTVAVRLGDLVSELINLVGINASDMVVKVKPTIVFGGKYSIEDIISQGKKHRFDCYIGNGEVVLSTYKTEQSLSYSISFNIDLTEVQADGRTLLEHCSAKTRCGSIKKRNGNYFFEDYTDLNIDKDIEELIVKIPLCNLVKESSTNWYPTELIRQAVINCTERTKDNCKKRSRSLERDTKK